MTAAKLEWGAPPPSRRPGGAARIKNEVEALKRRPGHWAKLRSGAPSGNYITYKKRGVMTRVQHVGENYYDIWGVWFGSPEEPVEVLAPLLEPGVVILLPKTEEQVTVVSQELNDERILIQVLDGKTRTRKLKVQPDRLLTALGTSH